jgi:hypothetical protein
MAAGSWQLAAAHYNIRVDLKFLEKWFAQSLLNAQCLSRSPQSYHRLDAVRVKDLHMITVCAVDNASIYLVDASL